MRRLRRIRALISLLLLSLTLAGPATATAHTLAPELPPEQHWHVLVDPSGRLSLDDVAAQRALFQRLDGTRYHLPGEDQAVWLHVTLPGDPAPRWLWLSAPRAEYLDFHQLRGDVAEREVLTGDLRPFASRPLATRAYVFGLPGDGQPREVFIRLQSSQSLLTHFEVTDEQGFLALEQDSYRYGALLGALLLLAAFNLLRAACRRGVLHAWLGVLQAALALCAAANLGLLSAWLPVGTLGTARVADLAALASCLVLLGLGEAFCRRQLHPGERLALRATQAALGAYLLVVALAPGLWHYEAVYGGASLAMVLLIALLAWRWHQGFPATRLLALGTVVLALGFGGFLVLLGGHPAPTPDCPACIILWCAPLAGLLMNLALVERHRQIQHDDFDRVTAQAVHLAELRTRADFLAHISHELRAPLNGVLGMTELLMGTHLSPRQRDYVQTIRGSGNELLNLINELLDLPKLQSGHIELEEVQFDLPALIADCLDIFRARAEQQGVELVSYLQPGVPRHCCGDPTRLRQVLVNLLDNALRQTEGGDVLLDVSTYNENQRARLHISVHDSGLPLSPTERDALLVPPLELRDRLFANAIGARIGLVIARRLAHLMHGEFGLDSGGTRGNTLWVDLPMLPAETARDEADVPDGALRGVRLLIVEDNETCRKVLQQQCAGWGMEVSAVGSGKEALALLRTRALLDEYFDAVLLDQEMPQMTGLQLATRIREDLKLRHDLLLIMLTGLSHAPGKVVARNAGIRRVLTKPVAGYTLRTTLADELGRRQVDTAEHLSLATASAPSRPPQELRVLVAEDDGTSTKVIRGMLNKLDIQPDLVANGVDAVQAIKQQRYDLVLMDCEMPRLDGYGATRQIRDWEAAQGLPRTPVVALTAHVLAEHQARAHAAGMDGYLAKPIDLSELRETIAQWSQAEPSGDAD